MIIASNNFRSASFVTATHPCQHANAEHCFGGSSSLSLQMAFSPNSMALSSSAPSVFDTKMFLLPENPLLSPLAVVVLALVLLVSAQGFINTMLEGDQGLGAFLRDGSGYNRSGYRPNASGDTDNSSKDPLPWLKLPKLDFVEVAGQEEQGPSPEQQLLAEKEEQERVYEELDRLRQELNQELQSVRRRRLEGMATGGKDEMAKAKLLQAKLEGLMKAYGIEYETDE